MVDFQKIFNNKLPLVEALAPGRVNLLGEHTDYNDGFVLPTAIPQKTSVQIGLSDDVYHFYSENLDEQVDIEEECFTAGNMPTLRYQFASYIFGCIQVLKQIGYTILPVNLYIKSSVPIGSGLASSAALEVATIRAIRQLFNLPINDIEIAQFAQQAEIQYAHVQCGIMDQMASSLADTEHMLFLDTRSLERRVLPLPEGAKIVVIDSGVAHTLANTGYNQRRAECEQAAQLLGVKALRDITDVASLETLPEPLRQRARHVVTENNRVLEAVQIVETRDDQTQLIASLHKFGELMNASHASLRDDYQVSVPALDILVDILQKTSGVFGARLTGAGFGGSTVALVAAGEERNIASKVLEQYNHTGNTGSVLVVEDLLTGNKTFQS
jgi:galactokinase